MHKLTPPRFNLPAAVQHWLTEALRIAACYLIPVAITLVSLLALVDWHNQYAFSDDLPLDLRVIAQDADTGTPAAAMARLQAQVPVRGIDTHLATTPFWFSFDTVHRAVGPEVIEFPSRHAVDVACWDSTGMTLLGAATRSSPTPPVLSTLVPAKSGFALRQSYLPAHVLCRSTFAGPGHISATQWPAEQYFLSVDQYHRKSGLLDGGMIVLALFVLIMAAIQRELLYVVFAGWLILNLRIGAMSAGWDVQWLGQLVPSEWLLPGRAAIVALFGISTLMLYQMLLGEHLTGKLQRLPVRIVQWMCLPTLVAAFTLPYDMFIPVLWLMVVVGVSLLTLDLVRVLYVARTRVARFFAASLAVSFASGMCRVLSEALDMRELDGLIDSVTAALASSLLAALAVAERMRVEVEQRIAAQAELRHTWDAMPAGLFTLDGNGRFLTGNPALCKLLGSAAVGEGRAQWQQFFGAEAFRRLHELVHTQPRADMDIEQHDGGRRFLVRATLARGRIEGVLEDITEQARETAALRFMSHHDPLTGVFNRRGIEYVFDAASGALAAGRPLALAFLELERYTLINDLYGHAAGDEVLRQVCERVTAMLAGGQHLGRIGGNAFLLVMPDTPLQAATLACRTIALRIGNAPYLVGDKAFTVQAALGLFAVPQDMHMADAIASADRACRAARATPGHGPVEHARVAEARLVARLSSANATEGLFLDMQPVLALGAPHETLNVEVLLGMRGADGSVAGAGPVIAAAETSGRAGVIDRWVVTTTLEWIASHAMQLPTLHMVCVKVSAAALNDEHFVHDLLALLQRHAGVAGRLCMTISERVALQDLPHTRRFIEQVREFGVRVALDEVGAFSTSLPYLKELPVDLLKIDGSFIAGLETHPANAAIVEAIVFLARTFGMKTIACCAHDRAAVRALAGLGVDYVQGDAVAPPQSQTAILAAQSSASFIDGTMLPGLLAVVDASALDDAPALRPAA